MVERPYYYVRFRWLDGLDLKKASEDLSKSFSITMVSLPRDENEMSLYKDLRDEIKVSADTLTARLSAYTAVLSQKEAAPFTARDMDLRKKVFELYSHTRSSPFPWTTVMPEPKFEVSN